MGALFTLSPKPILFVGKVDDFKMLRGGLLLLGRWEFGAYFLIFLVEGSILDIVYWAPKPYSKY